MENQHGWIYAKKKRMAWILAFVNFLAVEDEFMRICKWDYFDGLGFFFIWFCVFFSSENEKMILVRWYLISLTFFQNLKRRRLLKKKSHEFLLKLILVNLFSGILHGITISILTSHFVFVLVKKLLEKLFRHENAFFSFDRFALRPKRHLCNNRLVKMKIDNCVQNTNLPKKNNIEWEMSV